MANGVEAVDVEELVDMVEVRLLGSLLWLVGLVHVCCQIWQKSFEIGYNRCVDVQGTSCVSDFGMSLWLSLANNKKK